MDGILTWPLFSIGDTQTTVGSFLAAVAVALATFLLGRLAGGGLRRFFLRLDKDDTDTAHAYGVVVQIVIWVIGFELTLHILGIRLTTLLAAGGFFAIGAGFAAKNIVENFLSGAILRLERTIRPNDVIVVDDKWLIVNRMGARTITATTYDGEETLIPNTLVAQSMVINLTRNDRSYRLDVKVGVAYESDLQLVRKTLEETVDGLEWRSRAKDWHVWLNEFGDSSVDYRVVVWIDDADGSASRKSDLFEAIWQALRDNDITIAYPQLDVHMDDKTAPRE